METTQMVDTTISAVETVKNTPMTGTDLVTGQSLQAMIDAFPEPVDAAKAEIRETHTKGVGKLDFTPEEEAAAKFSYLLPFIKRAGSNLSAKAMARVMYNLAEFPLGDSIDIDKMGFRNPAEKQLFRIMYEINDAKRIILDFTRHQNEEERLQQNAGVEPQETGVTNGNDNN